MKKAAAPIVEGHGTFVPPAGIGAFNANQKAPPIEPTTGVRKRPPPRERETVPDRSVPPPPVVNGASREPLTQLVIDDTVIADVVASVGGALTVENVRALIRVECDEIAEMLVAKNRSYGNSALEPIQVFCKAGPLMQIQARIDDKLNRLKKGTVEMNEDTVKDLIGYLILLRVAQRLRLT